MSFKITGMIPGSTRRIEIDSIPYDESYKYLRNLSSILSTYRKHFNNVAITLEADERAYVYGV